MTEAMIAPVAPAGRPSGDRPVLRSPAGAIHAALGAELALEAGWEIPRSYGDPGKERILATGGLAVADVTPRAKIDLRGDLGRADPLGGAGDLVARLSPGWAVVLSAPGEVGGRVTALQERVGAAAMVTDVTHLYAGFALCGPALPDLLSRVTGWNPATLAPGKATGAPLAEVRAVLVRREFPFPVIEAYVSSEFGRYVWDTLLAVARSLGGGPAGWDALRAEGWS